MDSRRPISLLLTCEHGGNRVPARYASLFADAQRALDSHRGYDIGALDMARRLAKLSDLPAEIATTTRLLVDLNRSAHHRAIFSRYTRHLTEEHKSDILKRHYFPYRKRVIGRAGAAIDAGYQVLHVSAHSFTPVLNGQRRNADLGILYDPARQREKRLAVDWRAALVAGDAALAVRRNYPYRGDADGFVTYLRRLYRSEDYIGIELEVNQRLVGRTGWKGLQDLVADSLAGLIHR